MFHVEQKKPLIFRSRLSFFVLFAMIFVISACKQPLSNPEASDPIYQDLMAEAKAAGAEAEKIKKEIAEVQKELAGLPPRSADKGPKTRELYTKQKNLVGMEQRALYFEVRAEQRKAYDKKIYMKAFEADKPWPPEGEFTEYKEVKKLQSVSRNWGDRVPKTTRYNREPAEEGKKKAEKKEGGGGGH